MQPLPPTMQPTMQFSHYAIHSFDRMSELHKIHTFTGLSTRVLVCVQVEVTEWDKKLVIEYHLKVSEMMRYRSLTLASLKVHENEKPLIERTLRAPGFGAIIFDNILQKHQKLLSDQTVRSALSTLKISGLKHGGKIVPPPSAPGFEVLMSVMGVVAFIALFNCASGKSEVEVPFPFVFLLLGKYSHVTACIGPQPVDWHRKKESQPRRIR